MKLDPSTNLGRVEVAGTMSYPHCELHAEYLNMILAEATEATAIVDQGFQCGAIHNNLYGGNTDYVHVCVSRLNIWPRPPHIM